MLELVISVFMTFCLWEGVSIMVDLRVDYETTLHTTREILLDRSIITLLFLDLKEECRKKRKNSSR